MKNNPNTHPFDENGKVHLSHTHARTNIHKTGVLTINLVVRKPVFWVSNLVRHKQSQKVVRGLKFQIYEVEGLYYLCSENKGADQLRSYREADPRLCFRICKKPVFSRHGSYDKHA